MPNTSYTAPIPQTEHGPGFGGGREAPDASHGHSRLQEALQQAETAQVFVDRPFTDLSTSQEEHLHPRPRQLLEPLPVVQTAHRRLPSLSRRHQRTPSSSEPESEKGSARSRLAKFSRIALFGRSKTNADPDSKPNKLQSRKGPAAGTGHEGYGKFGRKTKKSSVGSSMAATDSDLSLTSVKSQTSGRRNHRVSTSSQEQSDLDDFAAARMKPIPILGGSQRGRSNPFPFPFQRSQASDMSVNTISTTDSYPAITTTTSERRERFPPKQSGSSQRFEDEPFRFPSSVTGRTTTSNRSSPDRQNQNDQSFEVPRTSSDMFRVDAGMFDMRSKSKKSRWNIFRRKNSVSETIHSRSNSSARPRVSVDVVPAQTRRAVPFYAMSGSETDLTNQTNIGQLLREAAESPEKQSIDGREELVSIGFSDNEVVDNPYVYRESVLLPTAPVREQVYQQHDHNRTQSRGELIVTAMLEKDTLFPKPPRLAQVGRIPQVVSTKKQPYGSESDLSTSNSRLRRQASREHLPKLVTEDLQSTRSNQALPLPPQRPVWQQEMHQRAARDHEFLRYADTRNSDFTTSSDSTGLVSIAAPAGLQQQYGMVHPHLHPAEDEVWNEYDDFMDDIMSPSSTVTSPKKRKKTRTISTQRSKQQLVQPHKDSGVGLAIMPSNEAMSSSQQYLAPPSVGLSNVSSLSDMKDAAADDTRLRRSRIAAALHASYAPSSPFSMRDFIDEYDQRGSGKYSDRLSGSPAQVLTPNLTAAPTGRDRSAQRQYENSAHLEQVERNRNPTKHSDQLYASLMVARWLSFGRVLFSPAHQGIESSPQRHILVIDGLGNEDWSIYCAVSYQNAYAFVHNLKERRQDRNKAKAQTSTESAPPNYRRSEIANFNEKFPFPPEFFSAIVIRFPPAMPDSKLKNIVAECRRVLAPDGYLELMLLDLDIVNMGVLTRRAMKDLKIKLTTADRSVSLKPLIDNVQTVLGSNGFSNLNRCVVGVPVVGKPIDSRDSSSESRSSTGSAELVTGQSPQQTNPYVAMGDQANFSLNDLVADHSENADAKIGKMVSRTAQSWWQHCFEAGVVADGGRSKSVFANKELLSECKNRASSFKLLIAYTQKASSATQQKRRTMSEPSVSTLATVGSQELHLPRVR